jgi:hypothetical protein
MDTESKDRRRKAARVYTTHGRIFPHNHRIPPQELARTEEDAALRTIKKLC